MLHTLLSIILFWFVFFAVTLATHYIYNVRMWSPRPWSYLDTYPFKCFRCMTTWALVTVYLMSGILLADVVFTVLGVTLAGLYGYGLYRNEKERIAYED